MNARLEILQDPSPNPVRDKMLAPLNRLYTGVLDIIFSESRLLELDKQEIKDTLGTIICAREPLTRQTIAELWKIDASEVDRRLAPLYSVISVTQDYSRPITVLHTSFLDFMLDQSRSGTYHCRALEFNSRLAGQCLGLMNKYLRPNICHIKGRPPNKSIPPAVIDQHITPGLKYAVTSFVDHWVLIGHSDEKEALDLIHLFLSKHVLQWFECLSLLGWLAVSTRSLEKIVEALSEDTNRNLASLAHDLLRFIQYWFDFIKDNAMEVHWSALAWIPTRPALRHYYADQFARAPRALCGIGPNWTGPERVITMHTEDVTSIAIFGDGSRIVSGSSDQTVGIWNVHNQAIERTLSGHTDTVKSVAVSKDGLVVISGSDDGTIRIWQWNFAPGQTIRIINTSSPVWTIAISPNDEYIASGHGDHLVCVWDAMNGNRVQALGGHEDQVESISFVPSIACLLVSALSSSSATAHIWDLETGRTQTTLQGHTASVWSVACSPRGDRFITGSEDMSACLWSASGNQLQVLRGHSNWVNCVAFLPGEDRVMTGSVDGTLRVWDVATGDAIRIFTEIGPVRSIAVFPDGLRIASCSAFSNHTAIWDMRDESLVGSPHASSSNIPFPEVKALSMAFSPSGRFVLLLPSLRLLDTETLVERAILTSPGALYSRGAISASGCRIAAARCNVIDLWELTDVGQGSAARRLTLEGHTGEINAVTFSHDESLLVSVSRDATAVIWDANSRKQKHLLKHQHLLWNSIYHASFSHDNNRIILTDSFTVYIWDTRTGKQLHRFDADAFSVVFTPDDRYIIASYKSTTTIFSALTFNALQKYEGYYWATLDNGASYAIHKNGRVFYVGDFQDNATRSDLVRIPSSYQIPPPIHDRYGFHLRVFHVEGPIITWSPEGIRVCLPKENDLVTLRIPLS